MIPITFYVFLSVIVMPDGTLKSYTENVVECPTEEAVQQMHVPKIGKRHNKRLGSIMWSNDIDV